MDKAADAFRTITEVSDAIGIPAHVLRFWESRFPQIKPVKRAGGRRYYRPSDVALVSGIRRLLHIDGMTIRDVQKVLREKGVRHVATIGGATSADLDHDAALALEPVGAPAAMAQVLPLAGQSRKSAPTDGLQAAAVQSLFLPEPPPLPRASVTPRKPGRAAEHGLLDQPSLPLLLDPSPDEVPEAPHIWVESEPAVILDLHPRSQTLPQPAQALAEIAAQLQPLPATAMAQNRPTLRDLHDRLDQLHAIMARPPRPQR